MLTDAKRKGITNESTMWKSIDAMQPMLESFKESHPEEYHKFMRSQQEVIYGPHYDTDSADEDVAKLHYTDRNGTQHTGPHWTKEEILNATAGYSFPPETTDCDKYVAFNAMYADLAKDFDDSQIIKAAYRFYFDDEDAPSGKVWRYMTAMQQK